MLMIEATVYDRRRAKRGVAQLALDFSTRKWALKEGDGWSGVAFAKSPEGTFEPRQQGGVIWLFEQQPGRGPRNIAIIWNGPVSEYDIDHRSGHGRIYDPSDSAFKDGQITWRIPSLCPIRDEVISKIKHNLPPIGTFLTPPNIITSQRHPDPKWPGSTNCGALPGWIALRLGGKLHVNLARYGAGDTSITSYMTAWEQFAQEAQRKHPNGRPIWIPFDKKKDLRPQPGDIYVLHVVNPPPPPSKLKRGDFQHVGVIVDATGDLWRTADTGQGPDGPKGDDGKLLYSHGHSACYQDREFDAAEGTLTLKGQSNNPDGRPGTLAGWVNIDHPLLFPTYATRV